MLIGLRFPGVALRGTETPRPEKTFDAVLPCADSFGIVSHSIGAEESDTRGTIDDCWWEILDTASCTSTANIVGSETEVGQRVEEPALASAYTVERCRRLDAFNRFHRGAEGRMLAG